MKKFNNFNVEFLREDQIWRFYIDGKILITIKLSNEELAKIIYEATAKEIEDEKR